MKWARIVPRQGLTYRVVLSGVVLAVLLAGTFGLLFLAVVQLRDANAAARRSEAVLMAAGRLERLVLGLDEGARGLVLAGDSGSERTWTAERAEFVSQEQTLVRLAAGEQARQASEARRIVQADDAYLRDYLVPMVTTAGGDLASARAMAESGRGLRQLDALQQQSAGFESAQQAIAAGSERRSVAAARGAQTETAFSAGGAVLAVGLVVAYLTWSIVRPVRRAAAVAGVLADGDLGVRMPERSAGEIGVLGGRFNAMVETLEASRETLRRVAAEQSALRRVATLVACGVTPSEVFGRVAAEVGHVLGVQHSQIIRFESDDTARVVGHWSHPGQPRIMPPLGGHWPIEDGTVTHTVLTTERPARMKDFERATSAIGSWAHTSGIRCVVGCPVKVEGRVWGAMIIDSMTDDPLPATTEDRMREFVELVGTAIANAQSRSDLLASRARVVAAADESRRRIERDLHDGAQQRLVALALKLRTVETTAVAPGQRRLREQLSGLVEDLAGILDDLQEVSRGIVPPILTRSGLRPALRSLARRSPVPVTLNAAVAGRLPESVEVAVYYAVSEALANVAKHAGASEVRVDLLLEHRTVRLSVHDDGRGGATLAQGSGLVGLKDRVEALGGGIEVVSPKDGGTSVLVTVPLNPPEDALVG